MLPACATRLINRRSLARAMSSVRIPPSHRGALALVATVSAERFRALEQCFGHVEGDVERSDVVSEVASAVEAVDEAGTILDALIGACAFGLGKGTTPESAAVEVADSELLKLESSERITLAQRLTVLFHSSVLALLAHAASLIAEDEYSYCTSRFLSDLRPLFGRDDDLTPSSAIIKHLLKFDVHIDGRLESVMISVDDRALDEIAAGVERAQEKAEVLREIAHKAGLRIVNLKEAH